MMLIILTKPLRFYCHCAIRLRENNSLCSLVSVTIKTNDFMHYSHQRPLENYTDSTTCIFNGIKQTFLEMYRGEKIRQWK